jgi:hypothetical protein
LTVTTRSLYAVTIDGVLKICAPCWIDKDGNEKSLACAAICAHDVVIALPLLKLAAFSGVVLTSTESLTIVMSLWMLCISFAAFWICWRISFITDCWSILPMSAIMDAIYGCIIFHDLILPLFTACSWLHASLRYVACSFIYSGPLFTCGHLGVITANWRDFNASIEVIAYEITN